MDIHNIELMIFIIQISDILKMNYGYQKNLNDFWISLIQIMDITISLHGYRLFEIWISSNQFLYGYHEFEIWIPMKRNNAILNSNS